MLISVSIASDAILTAKICDSPQSLPYKDPSNLAEGRGWYSGLVVRHLTGNQETRVRFPAEHIFAYFLCFEFLLPGDEGSRSCPLLKFFEGIFLAVSHWKLRMDTYGWVSIQPYQPKQAIFRTGFNFNVFFNGVLQFQLVQSLSRR